MQSNRTLAKIAEIFFASGIPVLGLANFAKTREDFFSALPILLGIVFAGGWHVKTVNDDSERGLRLFRLTKGALISLAPIPLLLWMMPSALLPVILIFLNWDFYSLVGKNNFLLSIINNFLGGLLHFALGLVAGGSCVLDTLEKPETFFFAFAMLCGSMHHDAYHAEEDASRGFSTGAVFWGADLWWKLAVFPMILSMFFLVESELIFLRFFAFFALLPYFCGYFFVFLFFSELSKKKFFRFFCRLTFGISALSYIICKIIV